MTEQIQPTSSQKHAPGASHHEEAWQPFIDEALRKRALEIALQIAGRLQEPEQVLQTTLTAEQQSETPVPWSSAALAGGFTGIALMYSYLAECFPAQGWDRPAQRYFRLIAADTQRQPINGPHLYSGASGLVFTLQRLCLGNAGYQKTLDRVRQLLCEQVMQYPWQRPDEAGGVAESDYDTISGSAGILASLLTLAQTDEQVAAASAKLLAYLTWLAAPDQPLGQERWFTPPGLLPMVTGHLQGAPEGRFNCGLAHGTPGPLAALALAWIQGYRTPNLREAIVSLSDWLVQHQVEDRWGRNWPAMVPLEYARQPQDWRRLPGGRAGWCYGGPGVARSLWLAGVALNDRTLCRIATETIEAALQRPLEYRALDSPTLCHGVAGFLQICLHFAQETQSTLIKTSIAPLVQELVEAFDPAAPFGYRDIEYRDVAIDRAGWLIGSAGVAMALLSAATDVPPAWDRCLMLS